LGAVCNSSMLIAQPPSASQGNLSCFHNERLEKTETKLVATYSCRTEKLAPDSGSTHIERLGGRSTSSVIMFTLLIESSPANLLLSWVHGTEFAELLIL